MRSVDLGAATTVAPERPRVRVRQRPAPPPRPRTGWPLGLLGTLALVAAVETSVARNWRWLTDPVSFSWRWSARAAVERAPGSRILCVGDSLAKHGFVPAVIEQATGRPTTNLAAAAAPSPLTYFLLRRAVEAGARPDAILVEFKPGVLAGGPRFRRRDWPEVLDARETLDLLLSYHGGTFAAEMLLGHLLPSYRCRHDVRDALTSAVAGLEPRLKALNRVYARNWEQNAGANLATTRPGYHGAVTEAEHRELLSHRFGVHRTNREYVLRTLDLAGATGARVYVVVPPVVPELRTRRAATGVENQYTSFLQSLRRRYTGVSVLDARDAGFPAEAFVDPTHLDRHGAVALSAAVAEAVRRDLDTPAPGRWVALPPYRPVDDPVPLEDVEQSRQSLGVAVRH